MKLIIVYVLFFFLVVGISNIGRILNFLRGLDYKLKNKRRLEKFIILFGTTTIMASLIELFLVFFVYKIVKDTKYVIFFNNCNVFSIYRVYFFFIFLALGNIFLLFEKEKLHRYRYYISLVLLVLLVLGDFTGSSLGFFDGMLVENTPEYQATTLLGFNRGIRGDEWATEKPMYFAQVNIKEKMPYFNSNLSINGNYDMVVSAFSPVKDIMILARPELWGFFLLGKDKAFSFYWNFRILFLFMAMYELLYILFKKNEFRSFLGALIITFSYPIQWWLSQSLILIIANGAAFCTTLYYFFDRKKFVHKLILVGCMWMFAIGYIFVFYPALQVPFGYFFLLIASYIIYLRIDEIKIFFSKEGISLIILFMLSLIAICIYFLKKSEFALHIMTNTVYPGKMRDWEVLPKDYLLYPFVSVFASIKEIPFMNQSEISQFWTFLPFIPFLLIQDICSRKFSRRYYSFILPIFFIAIAIFDNRVHFIKYLLFDFTYPVRLIFVSGYMLLMIVLFFNNINYQETDGQKKQSKVYAGTVFFFLVVACFSSENIMNFYNSLIWGKMLLILVIGYYSLMGYFLLRRDSKGSDYFLIMLSCLLLISTVGINPITKGTDSMFEKKLLKKIVEIEENNPGFRWMVSGSPTISNLITAQGIKRVSGTYYYPDLDMMNIIDKDGVYKDIYNQYTHLDMRLIDSDELKLNTGRGYSVEIVDGTNRIVNIGLEAAKELNIKYIVTMVDVPERYIQDGRIKKIYKSEIDAWDIYEIEE